MIRIYKAPLWPTIPSGIQKWDAKILLEILVKWWLLPSLPLRYLEGEWWRVNWHPCKLKRERKGEEQVSETSLKRDPIWFIFYIANIFSLTFSTFFSAFLFWCWAPFSKTALANVTLLQFCCLSSNPLSLMFLLSWLEHKMTLLPRMDWFKLPILIMISYVSRKPWLK